MKWPTWLLSPAEFYHITRTHPHKALFYLSVGGWLALIIHTIAHH